MREKIILSEKDFVDRGEMYCDWYKCPSCKTKDISEEARFCPMCGGQLFRRVGDKIVPFGVNLKNENAIY